MKDWKKFYGRIQSEAESTRFPAAMPERERVMAAHLKKLTADGRQVLFLCGAAHWGAIKRLLDDSQFRLSPSSGIVGGWDAFLFGAILIARWWR